MVARLTPSSSAHRSSGAAISRPRSGSCQVPTGTAYRTDIRVRGNATNRDRMDRWSTLGAQIDGGLTERVRRPSAMCPPCPAQPTRLPASPVLRTWPRRCCSARCRRRTPHAFIQEAAVCAERRASVLPRPGGVKDLPPRRLRGGVPDRLSVVAMRSGRGRSGSARHLRPGRCRCHSGPKPCSLMLTAIRACPRDGDHQGQASPYGRLGAVQPGASHRRSRRRATRPATSRGPRSRTQLRNSWQGKHSALTSRRQGAGSTPNCPSMLSTSRW